jgi:phosphatidylserine/phosphatidylglycerophosphate/cardiolipin synthase-like enzyme
VTLISPFWDQETVDDLEDLLDRRLSAGISITILGRRPKHENQHILHDFAHLAFSLNSHPGFHALVWEEPLADDPFGTQTFHFKAIVVDGGRQSYLGSANFTSASLRSRMELGVILAGEPSARLARIVSGVLSIADSLV